MKEENTLKQKRTNSEKVVIALSGYSTRRKDKVSFDEWFEIKEEVKYSKYYKDLIGRTL